MLGVHSGTGDQAQGQLAAPASLPAEIAAEITQVLAALSISGAADSVTRIAAPAGLAVATITLVGLGAPLEEVPPSVLRQAAGSASRALFGVESAFFALPAASQEQVTAVAQGGLFGCYAFDRHRSKPAKKAPLQRVSVATGQLSEPQRQQVLDQAPGEATALALVRDLVNTAPGDLAPADFVIAARSACAELAITATVLDEHQLAEQGYGGIVGVGQGSSRPPRLLKLSYAPKGATQHLALLGKGITFDTGGISLKPPASMETMKCDMAGGATVLGAIVEAARRQLQVRLTAWIPLAENMPSATAIRPSDVLTMFGGRTVEVLNTDAEGRLVLGDVLAAASAEQPDAMVDVATLTGAQMMALGHRYSAVMGNCEDLRDRVVRVAGQVGESVWPMPLPTELRASLDSTVADLKNIGERMGGMLVAGLFLQEFVGKRADGSAIPWAHLDIAGPAFNSSAPWGYTPKGGTGHAMRTLLALAADFAEAGSAAGTAAEGAS